MRLDAAALGNVSLVRSARMAPAQVDGPDAPLSWSNGMSTGDDAPAVDQPDAPNCPPAGGNWEASALAGARRYMPAIRPDTLPESRSDGGGEVGGRFSDREKADWWGKLCGVPPAHALSVLHAVEQTIKHLFGLTGDARRAWWDQLPHTTKHDVNLLLSAIDQARRPSETGPRRLTPSSDMPTTEHQWIATRLLADDAQRISTPPLCASLPFPRSPMALFKRDTLSGAPFFDGFVLHNAIGMDTALLAHAAAITHAEFGALAEAEQIACVRAALLGFDIHPDFPIGSAAELKATTLMRTAAQSGAARYTQYDSMEALDNAWEERHKRWIVEKDFPVVPTLAAALYAAMLHNVELAPVQWYEDVWETHVIGALATQPEILVALPDERKLLWHWIDIQTPGWHGESRTWRTAGPSAVTRGVRAIADLFYRLQQPENVPTYVAHTMPHPSRNADPVYRVNHSPLLAGLTPNAQAGVYNVAQDFDLGLFTQDRILSDTWIKTAYRLISYFEECSQTDAKDPVFDRGAVAFSALRANGVTPDEMLRPAAQLIDRQGVVKVELVAPLEGFLSAARQSYRLQLPGRALLDPSAIVKNAYHQYWGAIQKHPIVRARALANLRMQGLPFVPSAFKAELAAVAQAIRTKAEDAPAQPVGEHEDLMKLPAFHPLLPLMRARQIDAPANAPYAVYSIVRDSRVVARLAQIVSAPLTSDRVRSLFEMDRLPGGSDQAPPHGVADDAASTALTRAPYRRDVTARMPGAARVDIPRPLDLVAYPSPNLLDVSNWAIFEPTLRQLGNLASSEAIATAVHRRSMIEASMAVANDLASVDADHWRGGVLGLSRLPADFPVGGVSIASRRTVRDVHAWLLNAPDKGIRHIETLIARNLQVTCDVHEEDQATLRMDHVDPFAIINRAYATSSQFRRLFNAYADRVAGPRTVRLLVSPTVTAWAVERDPTTFVWHARIPLLSEHLPWVATEEGVRRLPLHHAVLTALVQVFTESPTHDVDMDEDGRGVVFWWSDSVFMQWGDAFAARIDGRLLDALPDLPSDRMRDALRMRDAAWEDQFLEQLCAADILTPSHDRYLGSAIMARPTVAEVIALFERMQYPRDASKVTTEDTLASDREALTQLDFITRWRLAFPLSPDALSAPKRADLETFLSHAYAHSDLFRTLFDRFWSLGKEWQVCFDGAAEQCGHDPNRPFEKPGALLVGTNLRYEALATGASTQALPLFRRMLELTIAALTDDHLPPPMATQTRHRGATVWCTDWILSQAGWTIDKRTARALTVDIDHGRSAIERDSGGGTGASEGVGSEGDDERDRIEAMRIAQADANRRAARAEDHYLLEWMARRAGIAYY